MDTHHESQERPSQPVSRLGLYLPTALLLTGALAWSGFWFYSADRTETFIAALKADESAKGRSWTCADQRVAGFPFRIEVHCASLSLSLIQDGRPTQVQTGAVHTAMQVYSPGLVLADVDGPLTIRSEGTNTTAAWENLRASARFSYRLDRLSIVMAKPQFEHQTDGGEKIASAAKAAEAHIRYDLARPVEDRAFDLALQLTQMNSPTLNVLTGSSENLDFAISGIATKLTDIAPQGWRSMLETWRAGGGAFLVETGRFAKGALQINGKGALNLDASRRLQGKLDVAAQGLGPIVTRFAGPGAGQMVGALLTQKDGAPVTFPLQLQDGRIQLGPLRTSPVLGPLY